jgi:hypothetical protein
VRIDGVARQGSDNLLAKNQDLCLTPHIGPERSEFSPLDDLARPTQALAASGSVLMMPVKATAPSERYLNKKLG